MQFQRDFYSNRDCYIYIYIYVVPAHQTSDMSRSTISPESRSKLEMVILSSLCFLTIYILNFSIC